MKPYLISLVKQLKCYSESLDKTSIFIDKPWAMIDQEFEMQKLIFRKNKELIMSKNGVATIGKWDYLAEAKSLLIDRGSDKMLFNEGFIDEGVMILKLDGTENRFFALANENVIPDLDVITYLQTLRNKKFNIITKELSNGRAIEIAGTAQSNSVIIGSWVSIDGESLNDGSYHLKSENIKYFVKENRITSILYEIIHRTIDGIDLIVDQTNPFYVDIGSFAFVNGKPATDGKYKLGFLKFIIIKNGRVINCSSLF